MKNQKNNSFVELNKNQKMNSTTTVIYDPVAEKVLEELKLNMPEIERLARQNGAIGVPRFDQTSLSEVELGLKSKFEGHLRDSLKRISLVITNLQNRLEGVKRTVNLFSVSPNDAIGAMHGYDNSIINEIQIIEQESEGKVQVLETKINRLELEKGKDITEKNVTEDALKERPRKKSWWSIFLYNIFLVIATFFDISITFKNIENAAEIPRAGSYIAAFSIATGIAISGHFFGRSIRTRNITGMVLSLLPAVTILAIISVLAFKYGNGLMAFLNIGMFLVVSVVAYFFTEKKSELIKKYFDDEAAIEKLEKQIAGISLNIVRIRDKANKKKLQLIRKLQTEIMGEYNSLSREFSEWVAYRDNLKGRFIALYRQQIHKYRNANQHERMDKKIPVVKIWEQKNQIPPLCISTAEDDVGYREEQFSKNGKPTQFDNGILSLLLLVVMLSFGSCVAFETSQEQDTAISVLNDQTDIQVFEPYKTVEFISNVVSLDTMHLFRPSVSIEISNLNDKYTNRKWNITLERGGNSFSEITKERISKQKEFYDQMIEVLNQSNQFTGELPRSRLYNSICETLQRLEQSSAEKKICLLFTDGLENTSQISFYSYRKKPQKLLEDKETIIQKLEAQCVLPDLTGIDIYIIHQPKPEVDELFYVTKQFWKDYFESYGAAVHFKAEL